jgi:uncharacterized protein
LRPPQIRSNAAREKSNCCNSIAVKIRWIFRCATFYLSCRMGNVFTSDRFKLRLEGRDDLVSAEWHIPENPKAVLTVGHGAGSNMDQPYLVSLAKKIADRDIAVLLFNFLYSEHRKKLPDRFPVASLVIRSAIQASLERFPTLPLFCGGKSFGGRMSSMTMSSSPNANVKGLIFFGFPLHAANTPSVDRAEHLSQISAPLLFLQGTRDALAFPDLISKVVAALPKAELISFEGYDHSFRKGKNILLDELADASCSFIAAHSK